MPPRNCTLILAILLLATAESWPQTTQPAASQPAGTHQVFTERSPLSSLEAQNKRHGIRIESNQRYELAAESFELFVPGPSEDGRKFGILVWVNAGNRGALPRGWDGLLARHHLIGIGANNSGNQRGVAVRFGLALDAVHNLRKLHPIDESRIYVSGVSGGGKVATMLAVIYPEVFTGSIPIVGTAYFRSIPLSSDRSRSWGPMFTRPPVRYLDQARQKGRFVFITGSNDSNRESVKDMYEAGFRKDGFKHVEYVEVPGMGHTLPPPEVIDRAIESLDAPLREQSKPAARTGARN